MAPDVAASRFCDNHPELRMVANRLVGGRCHLMPLSGGLTMPQTAIDFPISFLESGTAGGARATAQMQWLGAAIQACSLSIFQEPFTLKNGNDSTFLGDLKQGLR